MTRIRHRATRGEPPSPRFDFAEHGHRSTRSAPLVTLDARELSTAALLGVEEFAKKPAPPPGPSNMQAVLSRGAEDELALSVVIEVRRQ